MIPPARSPDTTHTDVIESTPSKIWHWIDPSAKSVVRRGSFQDALVQDGTHEWTGVFASFAEQHERDTEGKGNRWPNHKSPRVVSAVFQIYTPLFYCRAVRSVRFTQRLRWRLAVGVAPPPVACDLQREYSRAIPGSWDRAGRLTWNRALSNATARPD